MKIVLLGWNRGELETEKEFRQICQPKILPFLIEVVQGQQRNSQKDVMHNLIVF